MVIGWIGVCCDKRALGRFLCVFCPVAGVGGALYQFTPAPLVMGFCYRPVSFNCQMVLIHF
ncbi:hypothetical protein AO367_1900 [Moraxella catarrhalis]|nr:hypothetical protein AO367_1900 [Moraxella catarrhalis]